MYQEIHWNTIPAAAGPMPEHFLSEAFTLNHWRLIDMGEGIALEGHIHGRSGFPDGLQISTSFINCYHQKGSCFYFESSNSVYACRMSEYMLESDSIALLEQIAADSFTERVAFDRKKHYAGILREKQCREGVFLNWCGCDTSYLKWTAYAADGQIEFEDNDITRFEASAVFTLNGNNEIAVSCSSTPRSKLFLPALAGENCPVFIENSGTKPLRVILGKNKRPLFVQPGSCAAVKISFEPVYSVIN